MRYKPCRVTYERLRYQIEHNGEVRKVGAPDETGLPQTAGDTRLLEAVLPEPQAKLVRAEASRLRRNRSARELADAKRSLGLRRTLGGAFGGWE